MDPKKFDLSPENVSIIQSLIWTEWHRLRKEVGNKEAWKQALRNVCELIDDLACDPETLWGWIIRTNFEQKRKEVAVTQPPLVRSEIPTFDPFVPTITDTLREAIRDLRVGEYRSLEWKDANTAHEAQKRVHGVTKGLRWKDSITKLQGATLLIKRLA